MTATTTRRAKLARRGGRGLTPLEAAAELARVVDASVPRPAEPPPLDSLDDAEIIRQVEHRRAQKWADDVRAWLDAMLAGTPQRLCWPDTVAVPDRPVAGTWLADVLPAWMECEWVARVTWPELYEEGPDLVAPRTAAEAYDLRLTVKPPPGDAHGRRRRKRLRTPTLPGCPGGFLVGPAHACPNLRVVGHSFCPACEAAIRA